MTFAVEVASGGMIYKRSVINSISSIQKLIMEDLKLHRQHKTSHEPTFIFSLLFLF
jgi:hypothetical protein